MNEATDGATNGGPPWSDASSESRPDLEDGGDSSFGEDAGTDAVAMDAEPAGVSLFVASGYQNRRIVSYDGVHWMHDVSNPPDSLDDVGSGLAIGHGTIVVSGHTGIYTSTDGKTWNKLPPPVPQAWPGLGGSSATFGSGQFVIVAGNDSWTSSDAITFTKHAPPNNVNIGATHWRSIAYGNGHYFAVGDSNGPGNRKVSEDGVAWHDYVVDSAAWTGVAFGAGVFVAVGAGGRRAWSEDGVTLHDTSDASLGSIEGVAFGAGKFLVSGPDASATSVDGKSWTKASAFPASKLTYGGGVFATTTWVSNILTSADGATWTTVFSGAANTPALVGVAYGKVNGP